MKWVARLPEEPVDLAVYRAARPGDASASGASAKGAWDRFRADAAYQKSRDDLLKVQQGLCAYCEQRLTYTTTGEIMILDQQIEHVLPKSGSVGRTLDWTNLMVCCAGGGYRYHKDDTRYLSGDNISCGQTKADTQLEPGCDPRDLPLLHRIVDIGMDGTITANSDACQRAGLSPEALERTINVTLNLNCERLRRAREKIVSNIRTWIVPILQSVLDTSHLTDERSAQFLLLLAEGRLCPDRYGHLRAFWTAERQYLEPLSDTWIAQNAQMLGYPAQATKDDT